jgi:hypothetical protein
MKIIESYGKLRDDRSFDRYFWQEQGPKAIFDAAYDLIQDYLLIRKDYADEPRLKRTVESFQKTDLLISVEIKNATAVYNALKEFGAPLSGLTVKDFSQEGYFYQMGRPPMRVDIMMSIPGVKFDDAWSQHERLTIDGIEMNFISKKDLIASKKASGRSQDLIDVENLEKA